MASNKCTLWNSLEEKELAGKIYWGVHHALNKKMYNVDVYVMANKLHVNLGIAFDLYKKYAKYQNESVECNEIFFVSKIPYMNPYKRYSITRKI